MLISNFLLLTCTLMIVYLDARTLESPKLSSPETKKLARIEVSPKNVKDVKSVSIDKTQLERDYRLLEKWLKAGVTLDDARKRSPAVDRVINNIVDRIKQDPVNPGTSEK